MFGCDIQLFRSVVSGDVGCGCIDEFGRRGGGIADL